MRQRQGEAYVPQHSLRCCQKLSETSANTEGKPLVVPRRQEAFGQTPPPMKSHRAASFFLQLP